MLMVAQPVKKFLASPQVPVLSQINPSYIVLYFFKTRLNIFLPSTANVSLLPGFSTGTLHAVIFSASVLHALLISSSLVTLILSEGYKL